MKEIIHFEKNSDKIKTDIYIGNIEWALSQQSFKNYFFLTDENLEKHYSEFLNNKDYITIKPGENSKTLSNVETLLGKLLEKGMDRKTMLIGFGGGVVTDLAGFVASTYMRGIDFGFISTSLLGQVDAALGGKNGVNLKGYKNIVGTFNQPKFIISDPSFFNTLDKIEYINGCAEVIKQFAIRDKEGFDWLCENSDKFFSIESNFIHELILKQSKIKMRIVSLDEKESGLRKILNFGHSFAHAIEKQKGMKHGFAVSLGMVIASKISMHFGFLKENDLSKLISTLEMFKLPTVIDFDLEPLISILENDKKRNGDSIDFVLLKGIGEAFIKKFTFKEIKNIIKKIDF